MKPSPRPSKKCGACYDYDKKIYDKCYCACHIHGNYMIGGHHHFNVIPHEPIIQKRYPMPDV